MRLDGRRLSTNVDDRRGRGGMKAFGGLGIGGIVVALLIYFLGGDPSALLSMAEGATGYETEQTDYQASPEEEALAVFSKQILASTEDVWSDIFRQMGRTYEPPRLVLFTDQVHSGCGNASAECGPFYCSADRCVYIDLSFFLNMKKQIGADGDFAYAYVIAHEVGHHVQNLLGILPQVHQAMSQSDEVKRNQINVRLELQADFYAGVWASNENRMFGSLERGDVEEGINAASKIGDDYLQKKSRGYSVPDSFTHGTSRQRMRWLEKGIKTGDITQGDTYSVKYSDL